MLTDPANGNPRLSCWLRVREFAVPPSMIETATRRRTAGDWAGACAAARIDVDLDLSDARRRHGGEVVRLLRADLRRLAPDLLRWHFPRTVPDGLLRPGTSVTLARYGPPGAGAPQLVARTAPQWAGSGQRMSLSLWDGTGADAPPYPGDGPGYGYRPPDRRFRLDLHRHLWDARRSGELPWRSGFFTRGPGSDGPAVPTEGGPAEHRLPAALGTPPVDPARFAHGSWAADAARLLSADGLPADRAVAVRVGAGRRLLLEVGDAAADAYQDSPRHPYTAVGGTTGTGPSLRSVTSARAKGCAGRPVLPHAATWVLPDLELLRAGLIRPESLHPLVAEALAPGDGRAAGPPAVDATAPRTVRCRGARHRIGLVGGVLVPLDHDPDELRREELLAALSGTPLPCLEFIARVHRNPAALDEVRERLAHGDHTGALDQVEGLLGPGAHLRDGELRDALLSAARSRVQHGLFRSGLTPQSAPGAGTSPTPRSPGTRRSAHPSRARARRRSSGVR